MTSVIGERAARLRPADPPRTRSVTGYVLTAAREAIDLAASAGLHLDPWQQDVLRDGLAERAGGKWTHFEVAVIVSRQNGKGAILEARELAGLFLFGERLIIHSAHEYKTAMEGFRRVLALIDGTPDLRRLVKRVVNTNGEEGIELRDGARLRFMARSKGSGRGFSADCVIWDEAYALTDAQVEAQLPTLSARPNPQIWYTSSPPRDPVEGAVLVSVRNRGLAKSPGLAYLDWGSDRRCNIDDPIEWRLANPGYDIRIDEEFIRRERQAMTPAGFGRERLGIWPATSAEQWSVIPEHAWRLAEDRGSSVDDPVAFAVAMSLDRKWTCIAVAGRRADGLRHVEIIDSRQGSAWVPARLAELRQRWRPVCIAVNPGGPEGSLIAELEAAGVEVTKMSEREAAQAAGALYDAITGDVDDDSDAVDMPVRDVRHTGQPVLDTAIAGAVSRKLGTSWTWDARAAGVDISPAIAASNALWAHVKYGTEAPAVTPWAIYA